MPDGRTAVLPGIGVRGPCLVARLAGCRDCVKHPAQLARLGVERFQTTASRQLAACVSDDHHAVIVKRGGGYRKTTFFQRLALHGPHDLAGLLIECHELVVHLADEDLAAADANSATHPAAAGHDFRGIQVCLVLPQHCASFDAYREHIVRSSDRVDRAAVHDGLCLARLFALESRAAQRCSPHGL